MKLLMLKDILIITTVVLLASCGGGNNKSTDNLYQTFSLSTINSTTNGITYETQLSGSDTFGKDYAGSISIKNQDQTMIDGVQVTPQEVLIVLNDGETITNGTVTYYIDSDGNLISIYN